MAEGTGRESRGRTGRTTLDDLVDLAHVQKNLILRQSPAADVFGQSVRTTIEQTAQELGQRQSTPGGNEVLTRAQQALSLWLAGSSPRSSPRNGT